MGCCWPKSEEPTSQVWIPAKIEAASPLDDQSTFSSRCTVELAGFNSFLDQLDVYSLEAKPASTVCLANALVIEQHLHTGHRLKETLSLLHIALEWNDRQLSTSLIPSIQYLVSHMKHSDCSVRLLSLSVLAELYRCSAPAQTEFSRHNGPTTLVQLLKRDGDQDERLSFICDCILDFVLVLFTQDSNDTLRSPNLQLLVDSYLVEIIHSLDIAEVS